MKFVLKAFGSLCAALGFVSFTSNAAVAAQIKQLPVETQLTGDHAVCN